MTSTFTFASPWALSPQGREELLQSFRSSEVGAEAQFLPETSDAEVVSLRCTEECFINFVEFTSTFYDKELSQETGDIYEEPKLIRMSGTSATEVSTLETQSVPFHEGSSFVPGLSQLIKHEHYSSRWKFAHQDDQGRFGQVLPTLIGAIERTANVRLEHSLATIVVFGDTEAAVDFAISKLNTLENSMARQIIIHHHVVLEAELSPLLRLLEIKEVPDFRLRTTLLPPQSAHCKSIRNCCILVLMRDGEVGRVYPSVQILDSIHLWNEHRLTLQIPGITAQPATKANPISRWVDASNASQVVDPFAPQTKDESVSGNDTKVADPKPSLQDVPSTKRVRKVKGAADKTNPVEVPRNDEPKAPEHLDLKTPKPVDTLSHSRDDGLEMLESLETEALESSELISYAGDDGYKTLEPPKTEPMKASELLSPLRDNGPENPDPLETKSIKVLDLLSHAGEDGHRFPKPLEAVTMKAVDLQSQRGDDGLTATSSKCHLPAILPPFMPPPSIENPKSWERPLHNWEETRNPGKVGSLIDITLPTVSPQQTKGKMHRTMGQKKGQIITSDVQTVKAFKDKVREMLYSASACCQVKISASIGRILVHRQTIPQDYRTRSFAIKEWVNATSQIGTEFIERLTTKSSDGLYIIELKLPRGRRLFEETPSQRSVTYVVQCLTKSKEHITIEILEDGSYTVRGEKIVNGIISWHFAKRAWDACLQVTSHQFVGGLYAREAQIFVESLKFSQSVGGAGLSISLSSKGSNFLVQSMTLRREITYTATIFPDLQLHVTEVQALDVGQNAGDPGVFTGTMTPQDQMVADHRLWWEASISSQHADEILKESNDLELGENGVWKPEAILKNGVVEDMYGLAQDIVTRIDQVGFGNKGPAKSGSKETTKPSVKSHETPYELPTGNFGYW